MEKRSINDEKWLKNYEEIMQFMSDNKRRPSKYKENERPMLSWIKYNKKKMNQGELTPDKEEKLKRLLRLAESMTRVNQYHYVAERRRKRILGIQQVFSQEFIEEQRQNPLRRG